MKQTTMSVVLFLVLCATAQAQADSSHLPKIGDALKEKITKEMPGWVHRSIESMEGSKNVIVQQWELGNMAVKIAVTQYGSQAQATQALKDFKSQLRVQEQATTASRAREFHIIKEDLPAIGDEAFTLDIRGSEAVAFRKGTFLVHVNLARPEHNNDTYFSRVFAGHVASVLELQ